MFDAISPSEPSGPAGSGEIRRSGIPMDGALRLGFRSRDGKTVLDRLDQRAPCRAFLPYPVRGEPVQAILVNVAGGLVGGDRISIDVALAPGTAARITTQAAEKVYRSGGRPVSLDTRLSAGPDSWLEWMPQPTILFDGADVVRRTRLDVAGDARAMAGEILMLGRTAHGERLAEGSLFDGWDVRRDGDTVWRDRTLVTDWRGVIDLPAAFDGATASALFVYAGPDASDRLDLARLEIAREEDAPDGRSGGSANGPRGGVLSGATVVNGLLVVRWLSRDAARLTAAYASFWARFRSACAGLPATVPTIWQC